MSNKLTIPVINNVVKTKSRHIYILVPGTSDPINSTSNNQNKPYSETKGRANSYTSTSMYWDDTFYNDMLALEKEITDFIVFDKFGWSGDNCISNREVSGKYLINRLCMPDKNNPKGYYQGLSNQAVYFHLIGHSHGGNVMNEMTKQIDKLGDKWPKKWKIKSLTYLSTPFFKKLHQIEVSEKFFHKDAEVLHVYNDYDLTQNFVADFSMFSLDILEKVLEDKNIVTIREKSPKNKPEEKGKIIKEGLIDKCKTAYSAIPTNKLTDFYLTEKEGRDFYDKSIDFFEALEYLFLFIDRKTNKSYGLLEVIKELNQEIEYNVSDFLKETIPKDELKTKRQILDNPSYLLFKNILEKILKNIGTLKLAFTNKKDKVLANEASYSRRGIFADLSDSKDLIDTLTSILDINESTLISNNPISIWNLLFKILDNSIEKFDDTYVFPEEQFKGTFLENKIAYMKNESTSGLNVTKRDEYDKKSAQTKSASNFTRAMIRTNTTPLFGTQQKVDDSLNPKVFSERYYKLLSNLEKKELIYQSNPNQTNLMDMLFTLIAHSPVHSGIDSWGNTGIFGLSVALDNKAEDSLDEFKIVLNKLKSIFNKRYVGNLEAFNMGDLMYFMQESHSTSRRYLHKEVEEFLRRMGPEN